MAAKRIGIAVVLLAGIAVIGFGGWQLFIHNARASLIYCLEAKFGNMPADDHLLIEWLQRQPGIVPHHVSVRRFGNELEVGFIQVRTLAGNPDLPDLNKKCADLGYEVSSGSFRDCKNRNR